MAIAATKMRRRAQAEWPYNFSNRESELISALLYRLSTSNSSQGRDCTLVYLIRVCLFATGKVARALGVPTFRHKKNFGYGRNQKTCYREALRREADIVIMVHPDYQYSPKLIVPMAAMIAYGEYDAALGSRILANSSIRGGMPP